MNNIIVNMYGPYFLILFILYILLVYAIGYWYSLKLKQDYKKSNISIITMPDPDPYLLSYVRGGVSETLKMIVCNLLLRGYLDPNFKFKEVKPKKGHPTIESLTEMERLVFDQTKKFNRIENVAADLTITKEINSICQKLLPLNQMQDLIYSEEQRKKIKNVVKIMTIAIAVLGGLKLFWAISNGHSNIFFLIILMATGAFIAPKIIKIGKMTLAGEKYLSELESIYVSKYTQGIKNNPLNTQMLLAGIFGVKIFSEIGYGPMMDFDTRRKTVFDDSGTCGSAGCSSGGSCSGGSSCGGGCGGGCGGCGS